MRPLTTLLAGVALLLLQAAPAFADTTLFEHWDTKLMCPHGWHVTIENDIATLEPDDPTAYPGAPTILLFQPEYTFPYLNAPEDAATAAFEHLSWDQYVVRRTEPQLLDISSVPGMYVLMVEGQIEPNHGTADAMTQEIAVARIARDEEDQGVFAMLIAVDSEGIGWAGTVLGSMLGMMGLDESELTDEAVADFRLPATLD